MTEQNKNIYISRWLLLITFLVALMIILGGLTRLTDSGLSITNWDLISGILPPYTSNDWDYLFSLYQKIPEYKLLNSKMTMNEFKIIFWWEYIHRLLGRIVGLVYIIPLVYFTYKKILTKKEIIYFYLIFFLIIIQGFIGWYMVKSGLIERTDVSHYRLSIHLTLAFLIFIFTLWNYLIINKNLTVSINKQFPNYLLITFLFLVLIQISVGAFVSGLDAGQIYKTWPLMNKNYFPDDSNISDFFSKNLLETPSLVQFIHRNISYLIFVFFNILIIIIFKDYNFSYLKKNALLVYFILLFQIFLGVITIISGAQIIFASLHQMGSIILVTATLVLMRKNLYYFN